MLYPPFEKIILNVQKEIAEAGLPLYPYCDYRSYIESDNLFKIGREIAGEPCWCNNKLNKIGTCLKHPLGLIITNAKGGYSYHNFALGMDEVGKINGKWTWNLKNEIWQEYGDIIKSNGLIWGYDWNNNGKVDYNDNDKPHCNYITSVTLGEMRILYDLGGLPRVWQELDKY